MSEDLKLILATVYGEAGQSSQEAWKAVASVIINRFGKLEWKKHKTMKALLESDFDACTDKNKPFMFAYEYFTKSTRERSFNNLLENLYRAVAPIAGGAIPPTHKAVLYFSPKAQIALHQKNPKQYKRIEPYWAKSPLVVEVKVPGTESDDFRWFAYK